MMRHGNAIFVFAILWVFSFLLAPVQSPAKIINRLVAIVNSDVITLYELNKRMKQITGMNPADLKAQDEKKYIEARRKILDALIDEKVASEKIRELGIAVTPSEVDAAVEQLKKENNLTQEDLISQLRKRGLTIEGYRENLKSDLERMRLVNYEIKSKIIIREEEIQEYYENHKSDFQTEERVRLASIFLKATGSDPQSLSSLKAELAMIMSKLESGEDFANLARRYSKGPAADDGGDLGFFEVSQLDQSMRKVVDALPLGGVSKPIRRPAGIQILKVIEKDGGMDKSLDELRNAIYSILYREEVNRRFESWIKELREKAYTKIVF
jgi:peptidyl-prolyl cis-trans isomerase SurA